jgi:hypothetical protein
MNSSFGIRGIPPIPQKKAERMGHGVGTKSSSQRPKLNNANGQSLFGQKQRVSRRSRATSKLAAASLEVRFYYKNGRLSTEKGQNPAFLRIFLHAIFELLSFIINHLPHKKANKR